MTGPGVPQTLAPARGDGDSPGWRARWSAGLERRARWEFWPAWLLYLPMMPYAAYLAARYGLTTPTLVNPALPLGGIVGESKSAILGLLPPGAAAPFALIEPGDATQRAAQVESARASGSWGWPVVLKPDVGERGEGVAVVHTPSDVAAYLERHPEPIVAQRYHPGPFEAGVFYARFPGAARGRIISITLKRFAVITGDGVSTLAQLVWRHPRYRLQAGIYLANLGPRASSVPAPGERVRLGVLGNHCRGALFLDGHAHATPALLDAIDAIGRATPGFQFGRFDLRYEREDDLAAGRHLTVIELNGLLSESTHMYDPAMPFWEGQRVIRAQWKLACEIGAAQRRLGHKPPPIARVWATVRDHVRRDQAGG